MRKLLAFVVGSIMLLGIQVASAADLKVGVIDLKKILTDAPQVAAMRSKLQTQFDPRNKEIVALQNTLQTDMDKYNKDSSVMKEPEKKALQDKVMAQQKKLRDMQTEFQKNLLAAEDQSMQEISKQVQTAVDSIAKSKGFDLVLAKGAVAYNNPSFEVTTEVLDILKKSK